VLAFGVASSLALVGLHYSPLWPWCLLFGFGWIAFSMKRLLDVQTGEAVILACLHRITELGVYYGIAAVLS
jgi:hypothetical protein